MLESPPVSPWERGHKKWPKLGVSQSEGDTGCFHSILYAAPDDCRGQARQNAPVFFHDLNLDRIVDGITAGWREYDLNSFYYSHLTDLDTISYRQEVMRDLEDMELMQSIQSFSKGMCMMRARLPSTKTTYYRYQKERLFLSAVEIYCKAVKDLVHDLGDTHHSSRGIHNFHEYLKNYVASSAFRDLETEALTLEYDFSKTTFCLLIKNSKVTVRSYQGESDYSTAVEDSFEKFRRGDVKDHLTNFPESMGMNHIQAQVLERVALLHPDVFRNLEVFFTSHQAYLDEKIAAFDREIQFYVSYLSYVETLKNAGLKFCYPKISNNCKEVLCLDTFDLALAQKLINEKIGVICNDFHLRGMERLFVVSGPNQGGKTTFARTFGQLHYLACLGCPVPGTQAQLFLYDHLFSHFEKEEDIQTLRGKLQDDLVRLHHSLDEATPNSIIILNEIFSSTTLKDAVFLSKKIMDHISKLDLLGVCVTFLDELASLNEKTVSMVSTVDPEQPAIRTYKIVRKPADGLAYALALAEKYHVTYERIKERIAP